MGVAGRRRLVAQPGGLTLGLHLVMILLLSNSVLVVFDPVTHVLLRFSPSCCSGFGLWPVVE